MSLKAPAFWQKKNSAISILLLPLSWVWQFATQKRLKRKGYTSSLPVICIGNISVGGTGKTPTALCLATHCLERGGNPVILTRGFGGKLERPVLITYENIETFTAEDVGDEALLLATISPVIVSKDRALGAKIAEKNGFDLIIQDDGFQNPDLHKTKSIVVVDRDYGFGNGRVLPAGPLREPLSVGLQRADFVIGVGEGKRDREIIEEIGEELPFSLATLEPLPTGRDWKGVKVFAFAGIGRPEKFFYSLAKAGAAVEKRFSFGDHEVFSPKVLTRMKMEAQNAGALLVTTEKDLMRISPSDRLGIDIFPVRLALDKAFISDILHEL